ncbi:hypothetical protein Tco_0238351 [Tanacetum coccineum]
MDVREGDGVGKSWSDNDGVDVSVHTYLLRGASSVGEECDEESETVASSPVMRWDHNIAGQQSLVVESGSRGTVGYHILSLDTNCDYWGKELKEFSGVHDTDLGSLLQYGEG